MPSQADLDLAARGYLSEFEQWTMLLIHFMEAKLSNDEEFQALQRLYRAVHLDVARANVPPRRVFELIAHQKREEGL